jgi:hypothetical protein
MESGIQRAFFDGEELVGGFLDVEDDAVAVGFADVRESFQDEEVETALEVVARHGCGSPRQLGVS